MGCRSGAGPSDVGGGICLDVDGVLGFVRDDNCEVVANAAARVLGLPMFVVLSPLFPFWELALPLWGNGVLEELPVNNRETSTLCECVYV